MSKERVRYDKFLLEEFCKKNNVILTKDYKNEKINGRIKIEAKCTTENCSNTFLRFFTSMYEKHNICCENCTKIKTLEKKKITSLKNYGVEFPMQNKNVVDKLKTICKEKYGVNNISQLSEIKEKKKESSIKIYGVKCVLQSKIVKDKIEETNVKKYGVKNVSQSVIIKDKKIETTMNNYGVENPFQSEVIKQKMKEICLVKYGCEHAMQNATIMENNTKKAFKQKTFVLPSGNELKCQGFEPFGLKDLIEIEHIDETDIKTGAKNVPTIWYLDNENKKHRHYVDIYIPSQKRCIEIKSTWTITLTDANIFDKQKAAKELGFKYEVWVYDEKGQRVMTYL